MYYTNPVQPYGLSPAAQYGLSVVGSLLNQLYSSGQLTLAEYQEISAELNTPNAQNLIAEKLTQTYGHFTVNQASVQTSVLNMLYTAIQRCRTNRATQQQPYFSQQMNYGANPYQNFTQTNAATMTPQLNTMAPGMQPVQYQQVPQRQTAQVVQQTQVQSEEPTTETALTQESNESSYCGEAEVEPIDADVMKKLTEKFNISKIQSLTSRTVISCGACSVQKSSVAFRLPCHNRSIVLACLEQKPFSDIIFPEAHPFVTMIEWYRTIHIPYQNSTRPIQLLEQYCEQYRKDKNAIGKAIFAIDRSLIAEGGTFGSNVEKILIEEINRFAPTVFHRLQTDKVNILRDFDNFTDYHKVLDTKNASYAAWKTPTSSYVSAGGRLMTSIHGRFFNGNRKPYLNPENELDGLAFTSDPFLPYRYCGYPIFMVPTTLRDDGFKNYIQELMTTSITLVLTHRTVIHNLSLHANFDDDHVYILSNKFEPEERILSSIIPSDGLVEIIDINDSRQKVRPYALSTGYNNELVFWRQPLRK